MNLGKFRCSSMSIVTPPDAPVQLASISFTPLDGSTQAFNKQVFSSEVALYVGKVFEMTLAEVTA